MSTPYTPVDPESYARMLTFLDAVERKEDLDAALTLYVFDMSYPRQDILMAEREIKRRKGWR